MSTLKKMMGTQGRRLLIVALSLTSLFACSLLRPTATPASVYYSLDSARLATPALPLMGTLPAATIPTLIINPPRAAAGFDSPHIVYLREAHKLDHFAHSQWIDPPARMLGALLVAAIENGGVFRAVVLTPGGASGELRLDTEIIRLQHEFQTTPSQVRFTLRAYLIDEKTRRVLAWREFEALAPAISEDAYGGVVAANHVVQTVLKELSQFLAERQQ